METAYVVVLSFFFIFAVHRLKRGHSKKTSMQQLPPGPFAVPVLGHLHLLEKPFHLAFARLAARYGPVISIRLGSRDAVVVSSADYARECLTEHDVTFANRPTFPTLHLMTYGGTTVVHSSYGVYWRHLRRLVTEQLLSPQRVISSMLPIITAEVRAMARRMYRAAAASAGAVRIELKARLLELSLSTLMESIAQTKTSRPMDDADTDISPETKEFKEQLGVIVSILGLTNVLEFLPVLQMFDVLGLKKKIAAAASSRDAFLQRLIDTERRRLDDGVKSEKKSMLAVLLALQKSDPENYTDEKIMGLCFAMLLGGTETTSTTVEWAMSLLLNHPEVLKKAQAEIDAYVGNSRLLGADDVPNLGYLHCILKETLRLYPVAPTMVPHESNADCKVGGYDVPRGTMLLVNVYAIHRDPATWTDPAVFRPERFADGSADGRLLIPFGMGRRKCPGETMALQIMGLALGTMIQCFDWATVGGAPKVDMTEGFGITLLRAVPLEAMCKPRQVMLDVLQKL